jgi:tripartite-type tricarboxylate transporter receptor subunit TctC
MNIYKFKKLFITVALLLSPLVYAQETITILWSFNIGSNQANTVRIMCDELNKMQDKYTFVIGHKPGAGGTIAANAVSANPNNTLVSMSPSFIIRPYFEKTDPTHDLDNFSPILVQGFGSPLTVVSGKYTRLETALANPNLTIGISGIGSISHLAASELTQLNQTAVIANFKSMIDAGSAAAGGHVDVAIGLDSDVTPFIDSGKVNVLGRTGINTKLKQLPNAASLTANFAVYASTAMVKERFFEIHQLLSVVNSKSSVLDSYKKDFLTPVTYNLEQSRDWYASERMFWKKQVSKISPLR